MQSYEEALSRLLAAARPLQGQDTLSLSDALGRVLAAPLVSSLAVPPQDNSAMDGYAVRVADVAAVGTRLPVSQRVPAGSQPMALQTGTAARIFTGAPIPAGADAVVMQERCRVEGDAVIVDHTPRAGENIRRAGEDIAAGAIVLPACKRLGAQDLGLAASIGAATLTVFRRLRVATFFTGDELTTPGEPLRPGAIYNSNRYVLRGQLEALGCAVRELGIVRDDLAATREALRDAARDADLVLTCGGVSVGEEDHVKAAVEAEGVLEAWKLAIKPGKPLAWGRVGDAAFIGLPGNPVSSFVTFMTLVQPYIRACQGEPALAPRTLSMRADFAWPRADARREFLRVRRNERGGLDLYPQQGSGVLSSCSWADGLVSNPPGQTIAEGDVVQYLPFVS
ncbi:MAG: molybdopterin molybdotransferase MoeA [Moraxellaceae bacterium]|nr:molybdopterin molybdotransferase MoeA [Moraxellaceae bacterium]